MAPPSFPQGMTLHTIGYAALKYPSLAPELGVPLGNQIGVLQRAPASSQHHMIAQIASQYVPALLEYQSSSAAELRDESSPQYYFSTALCLLNFLAASPDVCEHIVRRGAGVVRDVVEKLLAPNVESAMRACDRTVAPGFPPSTFEDDFGSVLQFLSTVLLHHPRNTVEVHPRIHELVPKLQAWQKTYKSSRVKTISNAAHRLVMQIQSTDLDTVEQMRDLQAASLVCGYTACGKQTDLTACAACKIQRYCGRDHQKKDWKYHKHICNKGLVEETPAGVSD